MEQAKIVAFLEVGVGEKFVQIPNHSLARSDLLDPPNPPLPLSTTVYKDFPIL